jgi:hypothetical protein
MDDWCRICVIGKRIHGRPDAGSLGESASADASYLLPGGRDVAILPAIDLGHQADQFDGAVGLHFFQHAGPMFGHRFLADP